MLPRLTGFFHDCFAWVVTSLPVFFLWVAPGGFPQEPLNVNGRLSLMTPMTTSMIMMLSVITMMSVPAGRPEVSLLPPPPLSLSLSLCLSERIPSIFVTKKHMKKHVLLLGFEFSFIPFMKLQHRLKVDVVEEKKKIAIEWYRVVTGFYRVS